MLKWCANIVACATLLGLIAGSVYLARRSADDDSLLDRSRHSVRRFEQVVKLRASTSPEYDTQRRGFPAVIDLTWFDGDAPRNPMLGKEHPWLEIAGPEQAEMQHPAVRQAVDGTYAGLWYNPYQGVVRARVPVMISDEQALATYNFVNGSQVRSLFDEEPERVAQKVREAKERLRTTRREREMDPTQPLPGEPSAQAEPKP